MRIRLARLIAFGATAFLAGAQVASAQSTTVRITPGPHYESRNRLHAFLLGDDYRALWTTAIEVPVLDLSTFAGGLTPVSSGGDQQTRSLRLEGEDGVEYNFRSVDKELTPAMPDFAKETFADWVRQDQTSAQLPTSPIVATALLDAVDVLNPGPQLMVMPDDPRLGEFREMFAGMLGTIEVHPNEGPDGQLGFAGAVTVAGTDRLLEHLLEDVETRVDAEEFLRARLMDVFMGDYDRHEGQWRWARYDRDGFAWWTPVPEDRDYAFVSYDGLLLNIARRSGLVRLIRFDAEYSELLAMVDNSLDLTRRLLGELPYERWEAIALELQAGLTDAVIEDAVATLPPEHFAIVGAELTEKLKKRRDGLPGMARDFFLLLNEAVEIHGTDHDDVARLERFADGSLRVQIFDSGASTPRFDRVFEGDETDDVRVFLHGGADRTEVLGAGSDIGVRVIGGDGDDHLEDRSSGPTIFYDSRGANTLVEGEDTGIQTGGWVWTLLEEGGEGEEEDEGEEENAETDGGAEEGGGDGGPETVNPGDLLPGLARDWGTTLSFFSPTIDLPRHVELVIGGGPKVTRYRFRKAPYASRLWLQGLYAPLVTRFAVEAGADLRPGYDGSRIEIDAVATQLEATLFHGLGNDSERSPTSDARVWHERLRLSATLHRPLPGPLEVHAGGVVEYTNPEVVAGTPAAIATPLGVQALGRAGVLAGITLDTRDQTAFPTRGFRAVLTGAAYPPLWDLDEPFGRAELVTSAYVPLVVGSVLALRAGGSAALGDFPFYDAAFLGGSRSLRGYSSERFSGDRAVYGTAELRVPIMEANIFVRGDLGVSVFADAGRVYLDGESPGGWHTARGLSAWFAVPVGTLTLSVADGEKLRPYIKLGVPF